MRRITGNPTKHGRNKMKTINETGITGEKENDVRSEYIKNAQDVIKNTIYENGFDNNQVRVNFADICTEEETVAAAHAMGFEAEKDGDNDGMWWIYIKE